MLLRIERDHVIAHAFGVEREHAAELAAADHADRFDRFQSSLLEAAASCMRAT